MLLNARGLMKIKDFHKGDCELCSQEINTLCSVISFARSYDFVKGLGLYGGFGLR